MNTFDIQINNEKLTSEAYIKNKYANQWDSLLKQLLEIDFKYKALLQEDIEPEYIQLLESKIQDNLNIIKLMKHILYILSERKSLMYHNLIEMCLDKSDIENSIQFTAHVLDLGAEMGLWKYDQMRFGNESDIKVWANYTVSDECQNELDNCINYLPLVHKPKIGAYRNNNRGSGYFLNRNDSLILKNKHHDGDINREYLDTINSIAFSINTRLLENIEHKYTDPKTDDINTIKISKENWENYLNQRNYALELLQNLPIYFTHKYDSRGRVYTQAYHFNYQGDNYNKALLEFSNKKLISDTVDVYL